MVTPVWRGIGSGSAAQQPDFTALVATVGGAIGMVVATDTARLSSTPATLARRRAEAETAEAMMARIDEGLGSDAT